MEVYQKKADVFGALASGLCLIHCVATPFLFIAQSCSASCIDSPTWWQSLDYLFLAISLFAVYRSSKTGSKVWVSRALWTSWVVLACVLLNERFGFYELPEYIIYIPAIFLIGLHLYSQKHCHCNNSACNH